MRLEEFVPGPHVGPLVRVGGVPDGAGSGPFPAEQLGDVSGQVGQVALQEHVDAVHAGDAEHVGRVHGDQMDELAAQRGRSADRRTVATVAVTRVFQQSSRAAQAMLSDSDEIL